MTYRRFPSDRRSQDTDMAFDSVVYSPAAPILDAVTAAALIDAVEDLCPVWAAAHPDRALALLFVAPRDCLAVDVLVSLQAESV